MDETARRLQAVTDQALPQRHRVQHQRQAINQRVPGVGFPTLDGIEVSPHDPFISQGAQFPQFALADAAAGFGERPRLELRGQLPVELDQFAHLEPAGMIERSLDGWQLNGQKYLLVIIMKETPKRGHVPNRGGPKRSRSFAQGHQSVGGTELLDQRMPVAQPLGRFAPRTL